MSFFRKPQEKKSSAVRESAQEGKRALAGGKQAFRFPFFGRKQKAAPVSAEGTAVAAPERDVPAALPRERFGSSSGVIVRPHVTEKGSDTAAHSNAYVFEVRPDANKVAIARGVRELYGVTPVKVRIVPIPAKAVRSRRGGRGVKRGGKKAYVYLKEGDTIEFV